MKNKMSNNIIFRMAARCEAAGRPNNEDNYQLDSDLSDNEWGFTADQEISLGEKGALLVVCDGMGGMNAGEVASAIAVKTIKECFISENLTEEVIKAPSKYIKESIIAADTAIKEYAKLNPETSGMGSTIVLAWLLGPKVYVGWCGDSRCYRFNHVTGLERLSHDHSYVQELVDAGKLTEELAFDHPHNNIITRSLGDPRGAAQPDTKEFELINGDIILLCSDGLCGTLRDNEIGDIIKSHQTSMQECRDALWKADEAAGWDDNVTIGLAQIISGCPIVSKETLEAPISNSKAKLIKTNKRLKLSLLSILTIILVVILSFLAYQYRGFFTDNSEYNEIETIEEIEDTTSFVIDSIQETNNDIVKHDTVSLCKKRETKCRKDSNVGNAAKGKEIQIAKTPEVQISNEEEGSIEINDVEEGSQIEVQIIEPKEVVIENPEEKNSSSSEDIEINDSIEEISKDSIK